MSTIPAVLDELVSRIRLALPEIQVLDGGPTVDTEDDVVAIGFVGDLGRDDIESTLERGDLSGRADREQYEIQCLASSWRGGDVDARSVRTGVFALLSAIRAELRRDQSLGGLVLSARMSVAGLAQDQTDQGAVATARFVIRIDAFASA